MSSYKQLYPASKNKSFVYYYSALIPKSNRSEDGSDPDEKPRKALFETISRSDVINNSKFVVCWSPNQNVHKFACFDSNLYFIRYLCRIEDKKEWNFYEVILGEQSQKPHFDIDIKEPDPDNNEPPMILDPNINRNPSNTDIKDIILQETLDHMIDAIRNFIPQINLEKDLLLYTSNNPAKRSAHLIINNYCHRNNKEAKEFYNYVLKYVPKEYQRYVDPKVYSSSQQFRIFNNTKGDTYRPKILMDYFTYRGQRYQHQIIGNGNKFILAMQESLITFTCYCQLLPGTDEILVPALSRKFQGYSNNYNEYGDIGDMDIQMALDMLDNYDKSLKGAFTYRSHDSMMISLNKTRPYNCIICHRTHENDNPYLTLKPIVNNINNKTNKKEWDILNVYYRCHRDNSGQKVHLGSIRNRNETDSTLSESNSAFPEFMDSEFLDVELTDDQVDNEINDDEEIDDRNISTNNYTSKQTFNKNNKQKRESYIVTRPSIMKDILINRHSDKPYNPLQEHKNMNKIKSDMHARLLSSSDNKPSDVRIPIVRSSEPREVREIKLHCDKRQNENAKQSISNTQNRETKGYLFEKANAEPVIEISKIVRSEIKNKRNETVNNGNNASNNGVKYLFELSDVGSELPTTRSKGKEGDPNYRC